MAEASDGTCPPGPVPTSGTDGESGAVRGADAEAQRLLDERRSSGRSGCCFGVRFGSIAELATAVRATTNNIGLGGLCLRTRRVYEKGTVLDLVIELGEAAPLALSAVVAWTRPGEAIGVRFAAMTEEQRAELFKLLRPAEAQARESRKLKNGDMRWVG